MANFESIPGIPPSSVELLEAAGFLNEASLAKAGVDELVLELARANAVLKLAETLPDRDEVGSWIAACRRMTDPLAGEYEAGSLVAVNYEGNEEVLAMLAHAPFALPLPARQLIEKKVAVSDIPPAILLNRVVGDLEVRVAETEVKNPASPMEMEGLEAKPIPLQPIEPPVERLPARSPALQRVAAAPAARLEIDVSRVKSVADVGNGKVREPAPASENGANDRVSLIRAPRPETNAGRNPESRWFIRGVLHGRPFRMRLAALFSVILAFVLPLAIASACLLLASDLYPETFGWVPKWLLAFPLCLPVAGAGYLIWSVGDGRCRICNQLLFVPRRVNKNSKAHHFPLLGYIVPTALHLLVFRWFRCTYCGTAVRVKE